jgi:hypothetical protein
LCNDRHQIAKHCQCHKHSRTCYKYWKGPPDPRQCRFDLDVSNVRPFTTVDSESGEICMRCLDGLVNNFNTTILEAMRCNMDIKFIGSGASAKAILYFITDYITKTQLKTHVAYAALELAVSKLGEYDPKVDDHCTISAKKMLQKCAFAMISHQELSAQQVCSYLMDFEDHFTIHRFNNLYWGNYERFIQSEDPSPECYSSPLSSVPSDEQNNEIQDNAPNADIMPDLGNNVLQSPDDDDSNPLQQSQFQGQEDEIFDDDNGLSSDEIGIDVNDDGQLVAKSNQVADYQLRGQALHDICIWDFIAHVENIKHRQLTEPSTATNLNDDLHHILSSTARKRPQFAFDEHHSQATSHVLHVCTPSNQLVPVPIGGSIPRRDDDSTRARYCRLMLIFFQPWVHAHDLQTEGQSWEDAFCSFLLTCSPDFIKKMDNMQILHECRDSQDDHYAQR